VFQDSGSTVTVTLPVGTTTSSTAVDTLTVAVNSSSLGYSNAKISLVESDVDSLYFYSPITSAEIIFISTYNPAVVNSAQVNISSEYDYADGRISSIDPISVTMTETSAGSGTFVDSVSGLTVSMTNFTGGKGDRHLFRFEIGLDLPS
jgi:hypothetical protein